MEDGGLLVFGNLVLGLDSSTIAKGVSADEAQIPFIFDSIFVHVLVLDGGLLLDEPPEYV